MGMLYYSRQEGRQEGLDSERRALRRLIRRRFGEAAVERSDPLLERIQQPAIFEDLIEAVLDCPDAAAWQARLAAVMPPLDPPVH